MKDQLLVQYGAIRESIKTNVQTIGMLIKQAESLKKIVESLPDTDSEVKESLEAEVTRIDELISQLVAQTDELFDKYTRFVESVFASGKN